MIQQFCFWVYTQENWKQGPGEIPVTPMFIAGLFTIAKTWKRPRCPLADEWKSKIWSVHNWNIIQP